MSFDLNAQLQRLDTLERETDDWSPQQRDLLMQLRESSDEVQKEAWQRVLACLREDPALRSAMRDMVGDPVVYAVLRRFGLLKASLDERIEQALLPVRPLLQAHGGDVEIVEIRPPDTVLLRMTGSCDGCPASAITLTAGVMRAIRSACPEILRIEELSAGNLAAMPAETRSPFAADST